MHATLLAALLWFSALSCGVMAGLYFAFSAFIMRALGQIDRSAGIAAMNAINLVIVRSVFLPLFFGSTLVAAALAVVALLDRDSAHAMPMLIGSLAYVLGMFGVTVVRNVPLNNALAAGGEAVWNRYLTRWTRWNHLRTAASLAACALHVRAISLL